MKRLVSIILFSCTLSIGYGQSFNNPFPAHLQSKDTLYGSKVNFSARFLSTPKVSQKTVKTQPIHIPNLDTTTQKLVLLVKHEADFQVPQNPIQSPAVITLNFLKYGERYDYFITELGTDLKNIYIPLPYKVNSKLWYHTPIELELTFRPSSIHSQSWRVSEVLLIQSELKKQVIIGSPTPSGSGTSGPSGPRK